MVNHSGELPVSEQSPTQDAPKVEASTATPDAGPTGPQTIASDHEAPKADAPKVDAPKTEATHAAAPGTAGKMLIMAPGNRASFTESATKAEPDPAPAKPRFGAMAAMVALATIAGAAGGAFATMGMMHRADATTAAPAPAPASGALEAAIARIDADISQLKADLDHNSKTALAQFNKTSDRLEKIEKAQAEPNAKIAKLSEAVEKLRATPAPVVAAAAPAAAAPAAVAPATPKEAAASMKPPATAPAPAVQAAAAPTPATPPKPEAGRLPTVEGWYLTDVGYGGALIRSHRGTFEVYAGDRIPGLGRVDAIRKQDGHWVVVTEKGLIVARQ
jgi:hypothetical protein